MVLAKYEYSRFILRRAESAITHADIPYYALVSGHYRRRKQRLRLQKVSVKYLS